MNLERFTGELVHFTRLRSSQKKTSALCFIKYTKIQLLWVALTKRTEFFISLNTLSTNEN